LDGSVLIPVNFSPYLCMAGAQDDSLPCVGRLAGEVWLQPSVWREVFGADCEVGRPPFSHGRLVSESAEASWSEGLEAALKQRISLQTKPHLYREADLPDEVFDGDFDDVVGFLKFLLLVSIFSGKVGLKDAIALQEIARAQKVFTWHEAAKKRLLEDGQKGGWGAATLGPPPADPASEEWQII